MRYTPDNPLLLELFDIELAYRVRTRKPRRFGVFEEQMYREFAEEIGESFEAVSNIATMRARPTPKVLEFMQMSEFIVDEFCSECETPRRNYYYIDMVSI